MCSDRMGDVARLGDYFRWKSNHLTLDIHRNDSFLQNGVSIWPNPVSQRSFVQEYLLYFVYSTFNSSPLQVVRMWYSSARREKMEVSCIILCNYNIKSGRTDSLFCGKARLVASVHRTLAKSRLEVNCSKAARECGLGHSNPSSKYPNAEKDQSKRIGLFLAVSN